jgi:chloramphenicol-sensitive protein RarD
MNRGALYALLCYISWGFLPIYWKALHHLPGLETTSHRVIWSAVVLAILLTWQRNWQWLAIAIAAVGVAYLTYDYGSLPWIALGLASSFGFYALLKKIAPLPSMEGLILETTFLAVPLTIYVIILDRSGQGAFGHAGWQITTLLVLAGIVTALPLLLFAAGA